MNTLRPRAVAWVALALLALALAVWWVGGPFLLARSVEVDVATQPAGAAWSLQWADGAGRAINGLWLEEGPAAHNGDDGVVRRFESVIPDYAFARLELHWHDAPDLQVRVKSPAVLIERVGGFSHRTTLEADPLGVAGTTLDSDIYTSEGDAGGIGWRLPRVTLAQVIDVAVVYGALLAGGAAVWLVLRRGGVRWYGPQGAALLLVGVLHAWLAWRAPMLYCPDSMDYAVNAKTFLQTHTLDHFTAWRLPGYSLLLAPLMSLQHYSVALGWVQACMGVGTAWLAGRTVRGMVRPESAGGFAALAIVLVGLDPVLLSYERHAMPECMCGLLAMLMAYIAMRGRFWAWGPGIGAYAGAIGLGALLAGACYVRGNLMVLLVLLPFAIAAWPWMEGRRARAAWLLGLSLLAGVGGVLPWIVRNGHVYGRHEFVVGSGFTRTLSLSEAGMMDLNQTGLFSREQWEAARGAKGWIDVMGHLRERADGPIAERTAGLHPWTMQDTRAGEAAKEALARRPGARARYVVGAWINLMGLWPVPRPGFQENSWWSTELRQWEEPGLNHRVPPEAYVHLNAADVRDIYDRSVSSTASWSKSDQAKVFAWMWDVGTAVRPVWALLLVLGVVGALRRRQWSLLVIGLACVAHATALAALLLTGIDRYQAPLFPVMAVLACYGVAVACGAAPFAAARSRTRRAG